MLKVFRFRARSADGHSTAPPTDRVRRDTQRAAPRRRKGARLTALVSSALLAMPVAAVHLAGSAGAQEISPLPEPKVHVIQETGPASQRMNLIVMGDGYQADQGGLFMADLDRNLALLWATEPYKSYRNYLNVYAVEIASIDYGVRCDPDGRVRHPDGSIRDTGEREGAINGKRTALRMIFQNGCNDPLARGTVYGGAPVNCAADAAYYPPGVNPCETGNQAHNRILDTYVVPVLGIPRTSQNVQTLAIFNTFTYGGIGGSQATASGGSPQGPQISLHELGHSHGTLADEYPYSSRDVVRPCYTGGEPGSFHHTIRTSGEQLVEQQHKWWRWVGEESISGGIIGTHEGGGSYPCGQRRPSMHSMMRWIGFDFDQIGLEHMVARITGQRNAGQMQVSHSASGTVAKDAVLWVEPQQPKSHQLQVTWRIGGADGAVQDTGNSRELALGALNLTPGTVVHVEVRDPVGPEGRDWVRNPSTGNTATNSGYNGPRFVQTREWTVGEATAADSAPEARITGSSTRTQPVSGSEVVYITTNHHENRALGVTWTLNGTALPTPSNNRNLDLAALGLPAGTHTLSATVTDPAGGASDTVTWRVDNALPTAPRTLSPALTTLKGDLKHPVYFNGWDMWLDPQDDTTGYDEERFTVGQLRLNKDGWFGYYGFPEQPMPESPFQFRHSGTDIKALNYGNLGTGGLSKAAFEQHLPDDHPSGGFVPGFGTHFVEHRAIDPAGNYGTADSYRATVLPGAKPECTQTLTGNQQKLNVTSGVVCVENGRINGGLTVRAGASVVLTNVTVNGGMTSTGAHTVQVFGSTVNGGAQVTGTTNDVVIAGSTIGGGLTLRNNTQVTANERFTRLAGAYGPILVGSTVKGSVTCTGNSAPVSDFGAPNTLGTKAGDCAAL